MDDDRLEISYRKIARRYLQTWFIIDFLSTFPSDWFIPLALDGSTQMAGNIRSVKLVKVLRLFRLLKLMRLARLKRKFEHIEFGEYISPSIQRLIMLLANILFVAHLISCMWFYVNECKPPESEDDGLGWDQCGWESSLYSQYLASFYWTIATMMAVGYGEIAADNTMERIYAICTEVVGATAFGFIIATVAVIVEQMDPQATAKRARIDEIREYMTERHLQKSLQRKIKKHFEYYYSKVSVFQEVGILRDMPMTLRIKLMNESFRDLVRQLRFFDNFNILLVTDLVFRLKPMRLEFDGHLGDSGAISEEVYIVVKGKIQAFVSKKTQTGSVLIGMYTDGYHFEILSYVEKQPMEARYKAAAVTDLMWIDHEDLTHALNRYGGHEVLQQEAENHRALLVQVLDLPSVDVNDEWCKEMIIWNDRIVDVRTQLGAENSHDGLGSESLKKVHFLRTLRADVIEDEETKEVIIQYTETEETPLDLLHRGIIDPTHPYKQRWDMFLAVLIIMSVVIIPLRIGFDIEDSKSWQVIDWTTDSFFFCDMCANFRTAFEDEFSVYVTVPKFIRYHYLRSWFLIDFFSTVPLDELLKSSQRLRSLKLIRTLRLIRLFKLFRIFKLKKLGNAEDLVEVNAIVVRSVRLLVFLGFVGHIFGCFWSYVSIESNSDETWWSVLDIAEEDLYSRYIASLYWAFTTMTTVGYGDVLPTSDLERVFATAIMILGATVFGYIVGSVSTLASNPFGANARQQEKLIRVHNYLDEQKIQTKLRSSVKRHVEYFISQNSPFDEKRLLAQMPRSLRRACILQSHSEVRGKICLFRSADAHFIAFMLQRMRPQFVLRDVEINSTDEGSDGIYFLTSGIAEEIKKEENGTISVQKCISAGQLFGHDSFMGVETTNIGYRAFMDCALYVLMESDIANIIENQPVMAKTLQSALKRAIVHQTTEVHRSTELTSKSMRIRHESIRHTVSRLASVNSTKSSRGFSFDHAEIEGRSRSSRRPSYGEEDSMLLEKSESALKASGRRPESESPPSSRILNIHSASVSPFVRKHKSLIESTSKRSSITQKQSTLSTQEDDSLPSSPSQYQNNSSNSTDNNRRPNSSLCDYDPSPREDSTKSDASDHPLLSSS